MPSTGPIYLDYAATTPVDPRVAARMAGCLAQGGTFGNPGSSHDYGDAASDAVESARAEVAAAIGAVPAEIVWTSGATEADNLALLGVAEYYRESGRHLVTVRTEHKAVLDPCRELERRGWRVTYLRPPVSGAIDPEQVAAALQPDTVLVSVMHVNNETGVIQDVAAIAGVCAAHGKARFHVDAAQSVGKTALHFSEMGIDLMSLSAHKAYGPKGVGALVISARGGVQLRPLQFGGGQERNLRSGTVATHQVVGMGAAFTLAAAALDDERARLAPLKERLWRGLHSLGGVYCNGESARTVPQVLNVSFEDVEGESLLAAVRPFIAVSTGSACSSAVREPSYVLRALGRDERLAESSLRFSLGRYSTQAHVDAAVAAVDDALSRLRRISGAASRQGAAREHGGTAWGATRQSRGSHGNYNELTGARFETTAAAGELSGPAVRRGAAGSRRQGTWVRFDVLSGPGGRHAIVEAVRFQAFGCPHVIAVSDWVAQCAVGRRLAEGLPEGIPALQQLFAVPVEKLGRLLVVEDAWIAATAPPP